METCAATIGYTMPIEFGVFPAGDYFKLGSTSLVLVGFNY